MSTFYDEEKKVTPEDQEETTPTTTVTVEGEDETTPDTSAYGFETSDAAQDAGYDTKQFYEKESADETPDDTEGTDESAGETSEEAQEAEEDGDTDGEAAAEEPVKVETMEEMIARWAEKNEKDKPELMEIPYIELVQRKTELSKQIDDLRSMKSWLNEMSTKLSGMAREIDGANALDSAGFKEDYKDFLSKYPELLDDAQRLVYLIDTVVEERFKDVKVESTTFLADSLCESIDRKVSALNDSDAVNRQYLIDRMNRIKRSYTDRTDYTVIFRKLSFPQNVRKIHKDFSKLKPHQVFAYINKQYASVFNDPNMKNFITGVMKLVHDYPMSGTMADVSEYDVVFMVYWLTRMYEREYASGDFSAFKVLVMNVYDCMTGVYDLKGGPTCVAYTLQTILAVFRIYLPLMAGKNAKTSVKKSVEDCSALFDVAMINYYDLLKQVTGEENSSDNVRMSDVAENPTPAEKEVKTENHPVS